MGTRGKVLLGYVATAVAGFGFVNFGLMAVGQATLVSVAVSHPLAIVAMAYLWFGLVMPAKLGRDVRRVLPPPGPDLATYRCVGRIGTLRLFRGQVTVTVYEDRLTLRPKFMGDYVIHGSDIRAITDEDRSWRQLVIEHAAPGSGSSPVVLYRLPDDISQLISRIRRDPVPADLLAPESPEDRSARVAVQRVTKFAWSAGIAIGIAIAVVGAVGLAGSILALVVWLVTMLFVLSLGVREFVRHYRPHRSER